MNYTVEGLAKLLLFNSYSKAKSENVDELVVEEAKKYPYNRKEEKDVRI